MADSDLTATGRQLLGDGYDQPHEVTDVQIVFPANLGELLPAWNVIPGRFRVDSDDPEAMTWRRFQSRWMFRGLKKSAITPRADVDMDKALRHLKTVQGSYEPKHEHKEAAVAWLASRWFEAVDLDG